MKKTLLALISFLTLGLSTQAQATTSVYVTGSSATVLASPAVYAPTVKTYTNFWGQTVVVVEKNPKEMMLEGGVSACIIAAVLGIKGVVDICAGLKSGDTTGLLPLGLLEVGGATLVGALGYLALKSLATTEAQ